MLTPIPAKFLDLSADKFIKWILLLYTKKLLDDIQNYPSLGRLNTVGDAARSLFNDSLLLH